MKDEGRRKKEEGRRKKDEGRRMKEEGRRKKEEGRRKKEEGRRRFLDRGSDPNSKRRTFRGRGLKPPVRIKLIQIFIPSIIFN
ncbi:MAG: hypothetical protein KME60_17650 [Cyanomargarita calcarea GSE-NOS-MK-12-04C]|jgi:hypothetical protein|uniref:Uncharacterized protein n=1 Tax=Cyanomargarita calcarea GSE-NOS-MK-12-04C TaxID=2839659 RepID=A0A951UVS5_9CYAN|nr:hypothetical protein [Cyanomargarita calcarea GSE-NOS-MK-12-04C]